MRHSHLLAGIASLGILVALLAHEIFPLDGWKNSDFATYVSAAWATRQGMDPYIPVIAWINHYTGGLLRADYYVYTPFFAFLMIPFTIIPFHAAVVVWGICNLLFLLGAVACTLRVAGQDPPVWLILSITAGMMLLSPVRMELQWGQADIMLTWLVSYSLFAARTNRSFRGGAALAIAAVIKPQILLLLVFYLWKHERRAALATVVTGTLLFWIPFFLLGQRTLNDQLTIWRFWSSRYTPFIDNIAPKGVIARLFTRNPNGPGLLDNPTLAALLWVATAVTLGLVLLVMCNRQSLAVSRSFAAECSAVVSTMLLISPLTEWIYLTLLIIPLLLCGSVLLAGTPAWKSGAVLVAVYVALSAPLNRVEYGAWPAISAGGARGAVAVLVAAAYLYPLLLMHAISLIMLQQQRGMRPLTRLRRIWVRHGAVQPGVVAL